MRWWRDGRGGVDGLVGRFCQIWCIPIEIEGIVKKVIILIDEDRIILESRRLNWLPDRRCGVLRRGMRTIIIDSNILEIGLIEWFSVDEHVSFCLIERVCFT